MTNKVYVYGESYGRFSTSTVRCSMSLDMFEKTLEALKNQDDDAYEDLIDECDDVSYAEALCACGEAVFLDHYEAWHKGRGVAEMAEEGMYGFGLTKNQAKLAFLKCHSEMNGDDDDDWGDDED